MTFKEAKDKLKSVAGGYHTVTYSLSEFSDGKQEQVCKIYTGGDRNKMYDGRTWEEVFSKLEEGSPEEQMPGEEL